MKMLRRMFGLMGSYCVTLKTAIAICVLLCVASSTAFAQLDSELQVYTQVATSIRHSIEAGNNTAVDQLISSLEEVDSSIGKELESAVLQVKAALISKNIYEDTGGDPGETLELVAYSGFYRHISGDLALAWLASQDQSEEDKEEVRQIALDNFDEAIALTTQAVENLMPLLERIAEIGPLPPTLIVEAPSELAFSSRDDVRVSVTLTNAGEAPAKGVAVVLEDTNDEGQVVDQRSNLSPIPGKVSVVHTFFVQVPPEATSMTVTVRAESSNAFGDMSVIHLIFSSP